MDFIASVATATGDRGPAIVRAFASLLERSWPRPGIGPELARLAQEEHPRLLVRRLLTVLDLVQTTYPTAMFWWKDEDSRFLGFCPRFAEASGLSGDLLGRTDDDPDVVWSRQGARYRKDDREVLASSAPRFDIIERQDREGAVVWLRTSKVPDAAAGLLGTVGGFDTIPQAEAQRLSGPR